MRRHLSPPPMRRARPPARRTPTVPRATLISGVLDDARLAAAAGFLVLDPRQVGVPYQPLLAGEHDEAPALHAAAQGQSGLQRNVDAPGGEAGARAQRRYDHRPALEDYIR